MVLSFMYRMEEPILRGTKIHTCRKTKNDFRPGMFLDFVVGNRTIARRIFAQRICTVVYPVTIMSLGCDMFPGVTIGAKSLELDEIELFYKNDGFDNKSDFLTYFCYQKFKNGLVDYSQGTTIWNGKLIQWTDYDYFSTDQNL